MENIEKNLDKPVELLYEKYKKLMKSKIGCFIIGIIISLIVILILIMIERVKYGSFLDFTLNVESLISLYVCSFVLIPLLLIVLNKKIIGLHFLKKLRKQFEEGKPLIAYVEWLIFTTTFYKNLGKGQSITEFQNTFNDLDKDEIEYATKQLNTKDPIGIIIEYFNKNFPNLTREEEYKLRKHRLGLLVKRYITTIIFLLLFLFPFYISFYIYLVSIIPINQGLNKVLFVISMIFLLIYIIASLGYIIKVFTILLALKKLKTQYKNGFNMIADKNVVNKLVKIVNKLY